MAYLISYVVKINPRGDLRGKGHHFQTGPPISEILNGHPVPVKTCQRKKIQNENGLLFNP